MPLFGIGGVTVVALLTWGFVALLDKLPGKDMTAVRRGIVAFWLVATMLLSGLLSGVGL